MKREQHKSLGTKSILYTYIYMCIYMYIHAYVYIIYMCMHVCVCAHVWVYEVMTEAAVRSSYKGTSLYTVLIFQVKLVQEWESQNKGWLNLFLALT